MALTLLKNTASADLGAASLVAVPLGEPVAQARVYAVGRTDQVETGTWECTPGCWRWQIAEQEFCHFLQGHCTSIPDGGETIHIEAGDTLLLLENSFGMQGVQETMRKSYVIIHHQPTRRDGITRSARGAPRHP